MAPVSDLGFERRAAASPAGNGANRDREALDRDARAIHAAYPLRPALRTVCGKTKRVIGNAQLKFKTVIAGNIRGSCLIGIW